MSRGVVVGSVVESLPAGSCGSRGVVDTIAARVAALVYNGPRGLLMQPRRVYLAYAPSVDADGAEFVTVEAEEDIPMDGRGWEFVCSEPVPLGWSRDQFAAQLRGVVHSSPWYLGRLRILPRPEPTPETRERLSRECV